MADMRLDCCGCRRPDGPRPDPRHRRNRGVVAIRRAGSAGLGTARQGRRRSCRPCRQTALNSPAISDPRRRKPTASSISPCPPRPSPMSPIAAERGIVHVIGTTGLSASDDAVIKSVPQQRHRRAVRQHEPRRQSAGGAGEARGARRSMRISTSRSLEMHHKTQDRCAVRHGAACSARRPREGRGINLDEALGRAARRPYRRAQAGDIGFATLRGGTVVGDHTRDLRRPGRARRSSRTAPRTA